jgi:hypothetical protein
MVLVSQLVARGVLFLLPYQQRNIAMWWVAVTGIVFERSMEWLALSLLFVTIAASYVLNPSSKGVEQSSNAIVIKEEVCEEKKKAGKAELPMKEVVLNGGGHGKVGFETGGVKVEEDIPHCADDADVVTQTAGHNAEKEEAISHSPNDAVGANTHAMVVNDEQPVNFDIETICTGPLDNSTSESSRYAHELLKAVRSNGESCEGPLNADASVGHTGVAHLVHDQYTTPLKRPQPVALARRPSSLILGGRPASADRLPPGVTAHYDPQAGQVYYHNALTGVSTWTKPSRRVSFVNPPTPEGYTAHESPSGKTYYYNQSTGESVWKVQGEDAGVDCSEVR